MKVFVIAGEPSGDRLGRAVMAGLKSLDPGVSFDGIGGPLMTDEGLVSRFPMEELSVMGIAEVLPRYRHLMRRLDETAAGPPVGLIPTRPWKRGRTGIVPTLSQNGYVYIDLFIKPK